MLKDFERVILKLFHYSEQRLLKLIYPFAVLKSQLFTPDDVTVVRVPPRLSQRFSAVSQLIVSVPKM